VQSIILCIYSLAETRADIKYRIVPVVGLGEVVVELIIRLKKAKEAKSRVAQLNNPTHTSPYQSIASSSFKTTQKRVQSLHLSRIDSSPKSLKMRTNRPIQRRQATNE
jgi:hypothetical protein